MREVWFHSIQNTLKVPLMAQRSIPESSPSIKHTCLGRSQMAQAPHCTTHCNISLCHCWEVTALPQHPCLLTPTAHHGHQWVCLSTAEFCFDSEQNWPYWMVMVIIIIITGTFILENSYKNKISNKKYKTSKIPSPNFLWDLTVTGEDWPPEATKSN